MDRETPQVSGKAWVGIIVATAVIGVGLLLSLLGWALLAIGFEAGRT